MIRIALLLAGSLLKAPRGLGVLSVVGTVATVFVALGGILFLFVTALHIALYLSTF